MKLGMRKPRKTKRVHIGCLASRFTIWCELSVADIESVPGVLYVLTQGDSRRETYVDPRYDVDEVSSYVQWLAKQDGSSEWSTGAGQPCYRHCCPGRLKE